jgi:hypothetical protein
MMSYMSRFYVEVEERLQDRHGYDGKISDEAIAAEAERIGNTPSEFYPIMARIRPEAALDGIRKAWWAGDCNTIDVTAHDLLVAMGKGAKPNVSQENLEALLLIAQRWGEDEACRRSDEAEAEKERNASTLASM